MPVRGAGRREYAGGSPGIWKIGTAYVRSRISACMGGNSALAD